jgi:hypothetical protein
MHRRLLLVLLASSACGFSFDSPSLVKDLRVLSIQVDPPELTPESTGPLSVRALVVDPQGGQTVTWSYALCLVAPSAGTGSAARCPDGSPALVGGTTPLDQIGFFAPLSPAIAAILSSKQALAPQVKLELTVGDAPLYAEKALTLTPEPVAGQAPNQNPVVSQLIFDGMPWLASAPLALKFGQCSDERKETITNADRSKSTFCTHLLLPTFDDAQQQLYSALSATTGQVTLQQEKLRVAWFADQGVLNHATTQQAGATNNPTASGDLTNVWRETDGLSGALVTFWFVVRDGRGGESWEIRQLQFE